MKDLWGFTKESLDADNSIINKVLKEQATLLANKTDGVLLGKVSNRIISGYEDGDLLETAFVVSVPNLENYITSLFYVYSKPEENFPAYISFERVPELIIKKEPGYYIWDEYSSYSIKCETEIEEIIRRVLSSSRVNDTIKVLYQKAAAAL